MSDRLDGSESPAVGFVRGSPRLAPGFTAEHHGLRRYAELAAVAAVPPGRAGRRVQYWSFAGVADDAHRDALRGLPISYDITVIPARPMGWERPKTHGHIHVSAGAPGAGFPELYEVLQGRAGFLIQDLGTGPSATFSALIEATAGEVVALPPLLHHVTINLGETLLVVADVICRASEDDYSQLRAAHGMAHYIATDGRAVPNGTYRAVPSLERLTASGWSDSRGGDLYRNLVHDPAALAWLCSPEAFAARFPGPWRRVVAGGRRQGTADRGE